MSGRYTCLDDAPANGSLASGTGSGPQTVKVRHADVAYRHTPAEGGWFAACLAVDDGHRHECLVRRRGEEPLARVERAVEVEHRSFLDQPAA